MRRITAAKKPACAAAIAIITLVGLVVAPSTAAAAPDKTICTNIAVPVSIQVTPLATQPANISGTLCVPPSATTVEVLLSGWTYDRTYWDIGYQPDTYSYVRAANSKGYATFAMDRLGTGQSTKPLSAFDTLYADASTVHQVITKLRNGSLGTSFTKVIGVGHSFGSVISLTEAGVYHDVDAVISTGITNTFNIANVLEIAPLSDYPSVLDPKFSHDNLDVGYVTSYPDTRKVFYYDNPQATDPNVVALDEQRKSVGNVVELATLAGFLLDNQTRTLNIPVYFVLGEKDQIICGSTGVDCSSAQSIVDFERPFFGPNATLDGYIAPNSGHDLQLERNAPTTDAKMLDFADQHVGAGAGEQNTAPGDAAPVPPSTQPSPTALAKLIDAEVVPVVAPIITLLQKKTLTVTGNQQSSLPGLSAGLSTVGNLVNTLVGTFPATLLGG